MDEQTEIYLLFIKNRQFVNFVLKTSEFYKGFSLHVGKQLDNRKLLDSTLKTKETK